MADHPDGRAVLGLLRPDAFRVEAPDLYDTIAAEVAVVRGGADDRVSLPMAVKIPLVVTVFMAAVAMSVLERVLPVPGGPPSISATGRDLPRRTCVVARRPGGP